MANFNVGSLGEYIREQRRAAQISLRQLAEAAGVSNPYLSQIERGLRKPSAEILQQIAKGLRVSAEALYVQAGILEDRETETEVPAAVRADGSLNDRQKQVLLEIYESFRKENRASAGPSASPKSSPGAAGEKPDMRQRPPRPRDAWQEATESVAGPQEPAATTKKKTTGREEESS